MKNDINCLNNSISHLQNRLSKIENNLLTSPFQGWFVVSSKSLLFAPFNNFTGPSGYTSNLDDKSSYFIKYVYFDQISHYPNVVVKFYPLMYNNVFEAIYREQVYEFCLNDSNTILWKNAPNTKSFTPESASNFINSLIGGSSSICPSNFTAQINNNDEIIANCNFLPDQTYQNIYISVLNRCSEAPLIIPYNKTAVKMKQYTLPIEIFNFYDEMVRESYGLYNDAINKDSYYDNFTRNMKIKKQYEEGLTLTYDIDHVVKSTNNQTDYGYGICDPNGLTRIHLKQMHYITPGSTITISGFTGNWSVLNGTFTNHIPHSFALDMVDQNDNDHMDQTSMKDYALGFCLKFDSSNLDSIIFGPKHGWGIYTGNPKVTVTHQINHEMSYANFIGALLAYHQQVYGTTEHGLLSYLIKNDGTGVPLDDWNDTEYLNWIISKQSFLSQLNYASGINQFYNSISDLSTTWIPADNYNIVDKLTMIPDYKYGINIAQNYMENLQLNQLWYKITGSLTVPNNDESKLIRKFQEEICEMYMVDPGSQIKFTHSIKGENPNGDNWIPFGVSTLDDPKIALNFFNFGIINQSLTPNKKIGYISINYSLPCITETASLLWTRNAFFPENQTFESQKNHPNEWSGLWAQPIGYIIRWFNSQNCTDLIIDSVSNLGGYADWISQHFGENRYSTNKTTIFTNTINQKSKIEDINDFVSYGKPENKFSEIQCTYLNQTYGQGTVFNKGKIILLVSENTFSAGNILRFHFIGNDQNNIISSNMKIKILGGFKGYVGGSSIGLSYIPNNLLGNLSDTILNTSISGECPEYEYNINSLKKLIGLNKISNNSKTSESSSILKGSGNAFKSGFENLIYPDFGFCNNLRPLLDGDERQQTPNPDDWTTWRFAYLESAISEMKLNW